MTFTQLEIFVLVADLGGFTAAAGKLGISQSAVSQTLSAAGATAIIAGFEELVAPG